MLNVKIPNVSKNQQIYSLGILINEFLGIKFKYEIYDGDLIEISNLNDVKNFSKLTLNANFFNNAKHHWLKYESMPNLPLENWTPSDDGLHANLTLTSIPILFGTPGIIKKKKSYTFKCRYFWKLLFYAISL